MRGIRWINWCIKLVLFTCCSALKYVKHLKILRWGYNCPYDNGALAATWISWYFHNHRIVGAPCFDYFSSGALNQPSNCGTTCCSYFSCFGVSHMHGAHGLKYERQSSQIGLDFVAFLCCGEQAARMLCAEGPLQLTLRELQLYEEPSFVNCIS